MQNVLCRQKIVLSSGTVPTTFELNLTQCFTEFTSESYCFHTYTVCVSKREKTVLILVPELMLPITKNVWPLVTQDDI
jgi:hypothetical protein